LIAIGWGLGRRLGLFLKTTGKSSPSSIDRPPLEGRRYGVPLLDQSKLKCPMVYELSHSITISSKVFVRCSQQSLTKRAAGMASVWSFCYVPPLLKFRVPCKKASHHRQRFNPGRQSILDDMVISAMFGGKGGDKLKSIQAHQIYCFTRFHPTDSTCHDSEIHEQTLDCSRVSRQPPACNRGEWWRLRGSWGW